MKSKYPHRNLIRATLLGLLAAILLPLIFANRLLSHVLAGSPANESSQPDSDQAKVAAIADRYGKLPLRFEVNEGQAEEQVKFLSRGPGYDLFLTASGALLSLREPNPQPQKCDPSAPCPDTSSAPRPATLLRLTMIGANSAAPVEGREELPGKINYLIGNDQDHWHTNIPTYLKVHYTAVYPGVDLVYYGNRTELEYDFIVAVGGNLKAIKFQLDGADRITLDRDGNLLLTVKQSEVKLRKPLIYQLSDEGDRREVKGEYVLQGRQVGFKVKSFDRSKPLIIDPVLSYSTLLGSGGNESGAGIAVDSSGNAYITGSGSVPTTPGAFQTTTISDAAFITKLDATGSNLVYSTYLGGSNGGSLGNAIAVNAAGNAYITGRTNSSDFPNVNGFRGGSSNLYKTLDSGAHWNGQVVGPAGGGVNVLAVDPLAPNTMYAGMNVNAGGGIYKTIDGGVTWNALNTGLTTPFCAAIAVDPLTPTTLYASLTLPLGSSSSGLYKSSDGGTSWSKLATGLSGVTVSALAIDPVSPSTIYAGESFAGVYKSTNGGASWVNSSTGITFGGTGAIAVDPNNPQTVYLSAGGGGVFKTINGGGNWAQANTGITVGFVRTLNIDSASNIYAGTISGGIFKSTNAGGNWNPITGNISGVVDVSSLALNPSAPSAIYFGTGNGKLYKTVDGGSNWTLVYETLTRTAFRSLVINSSAPATVYAAADTAFGSLSDYEAFVSKLNASGSGLVYSTYLGGGSDDFGNAIAVDVNGNAVVAGQTASTGFLTFNAYQPTIAGSTDGFVAKVNPAGDALLFSTYLGGTNSDTVNGIAVDAVGNAYVAGTTSSSNFPIANAFQSAFGGGSFGADAFATKFNANGTLGYSTYLGGSGLDSGFAIAVDASGNAYVTGTTGSTNFPIANAPDGAGAAGGAFVTKFNNLGSGLIYSTYLGGPGAATGRGIAVDSAGNAYVTGFTASEFPVVAGALQTRSPFFRSDNAGSSWGNDNYSLKGGFSSLAIDPLSPSTVFASTSAGFYKSGNGGNSWTLINTPGIPSFAEILIDPITPANLFGFSNNSFSSTSGVYRSTNGGNSWTRVVSGMTNVAVLSLAIDPLTPTTLYAGTYGGPLFKSVNSGDSWTPVGSPAIAFANSIAIDPTNSNILYAADNVSDGGLFKSVNAGVSWQAVGSAQMGFFCTFVAVNPLAHAKVYATCNTGLFKSVDSGNTWTLAGPYGFTKTVFDPVNSSAIYLVTTSQGILKSVDDGQTWQAINNGLRSTAAVSLKVNPAKPATLYAAMSSSGDSDAFVTKINSSGSALVYSTYLGGSLGDFFVSNNNDFGYALALDSAGNAYVTGESRSLDFPTSPNSFQPFNRGFVDAFASKVTMSYSIAGQVLDGGNAPVSGAEITLVDGATVSTVLSESDGSYQFSHLREGGSFTVSAAKPHFTITPQSQTFNNLTSNQTLNFLATATAAPFFTISGTVTNNGVGLSGVSVTLSGAQPGVRTTDSNGNYSFTLAGGNYTVTPSTIAYIFSPPSRTFNNLSADQTSDFTATRQNFVVTNANDHGTGSLRQAMLDANATAGLDTITFNIPAAGVQTINLLVVLPEITDPVVIDAATQPGYAGSPLVELNGLGVGTSNANGFFVTAGGSTIRGFAINRFNRNGIYLSTSDNNVIQGNYVGTDATGTIRRGNNYGIEVYKSSNNTIGGTTPAARNVISANSFYGISMYGSNNQIAGNFIGTNAAGTANLGNGISGIDIVNLASPPAVNNVIGGTAPGAGNLISGNQRGISINSSGQSIMGNLIGTDISGTMAVPNGTGISASSAGTIIGGTVPGSRNIISGNSGDGVDFGGPGSRLEGNFIGTDITGTRTLGNSGSGVGAGNGCLIGGTTAAARNVISGNGGNGNISLGSNSSGQQATVQGNYIGTDLTGNIALNNPSAGISISGSLNLIGGLVPGAQNVISGNVTGIQIGGSIFPGPEGNLVQGNLIGLNALGTAPLGNSFVGVSISSSSNNVIGGTAAGAANKISFNGGSGFNGGAGVMVFSGTGNSVRGNSIFANTNLGIDLNGDGVTANDSSDADTGPNNFQNFPLLTSSSSNGSTTTIQGTLNSKPNTVFQIDFYSNAGCDPSGNGEGARFFDTTSITTDANGNASINFVSSLALPAGRVISATTTDPTGNTSEFSACDAANAAGSVQFSSAAYSVLEDIGNATITLVRSGGSKGTVSVNYSTADVTATAGSDYTAASGAVVFADGETSKTFSVPIANDGVTEPDETARLTLTSADVENLGSPAAAILTILDNSTPLVLDTNQVSLLEGNSGVRNAIVTVSLSAATGRTVTVNFNTSGSSATSGVDFTPVSGTLTFAPGTATQTISVPVIGDTLNEANENFFINLSNPVNATIQSLGFVQIINDDPLPSLSISDLSITEGNSGTVSAVFTVSLSTASGRTLSVGYQTANGTATAGSDFVTTSGRVSFSAGETIKTVTVQVSGDTVAEADETFFVNLSAPSNAAISDNQAIGTILNDDGAGPMISFSQANYTVGESAGSAVVTVNRSGDTSAAVTVDYSTSEVAPVGSCATSNGIASSRCDFTTALGTLRFAAGESSKTFRVLISQDNYVEGPESLMLTLSNLSGGAVFAVPATASLTITDDASEPPSNPINDADVFVRQHYHDFLNREPDAGGLAFWSNQITECQQPGATCSVETRRINVSAAFFLSIEFQETGYLVERIYKSAYGDALGTSNFGPTHQLPVPVVRFNEFLPDTQAIGQDVVVGVGDWQTQLENNKVAFTQGFVARARFVSAYPLTLTPADFVDALFSHAGVTPSASERTSIINEFAGAGNTTDVAARARALRRAAENSTLKQQETNKAFVLMQYFGYLRRNPNDQPDADYSGYDFWLTKLNEFNGNFVNAEMVKAFIVSGEYRQRFGP
jgi:hypothetical protein